MATPLSSILIKIFIPLLLLQCHGVTVKSQQPSPPLSQSETVSFGITDFEKDNVDIVVIGDASVSGGALRLTKTDRTGKPLPKSVGRAMHLTPVHLWDKNSGELADFTTSFSFVVNTNGSTLHGDGFAFVMAPLRFHSVHANSSGGYLGLVSPDFAFDRSRNEFLAIEFDSFTNEWDPSFPFQSPHVGIDVDTINSVSSVPWPIDVVPPNAIGEASINYNSESKRLSVFLAYPGSNRNATSVSAVVDLRTVLPEWVRVGFSAATGELVETHDIINWAFEAAL